jgi:hypothetical protein
MVIPRWDVVLEGGKQGGIITGKLLGGQGKNLLFEKNPLYFPRSRADARSIMRAIEDWEHRRRIDSGNVRRLT